MNTLESLALSTSVLISAAVWSAVAEASIPSNLEPSVAISRPSTVPETLIFPLISNPTEVTIPDKFAPAPVIPAL